MDRRQFFRTAALITAGAVAADQIEILDRLGWVRRLFPSAPIMPTLWGDGWHDDAPAIQAMVDGLAVFDAQRNVTLPGGRPITLIGGYHRLGKTIDLSNGVDGGLISDCCFITYYAEGNHAWR